MKGWPMKAKRKARMAERDVKDAGSELKYRTKAGVERGKRAIAGGAMTTRQKATSVIKETGDRVAAEAARGRRKLREEVE